MSEEKLAEFFEPLARAHYLVVGKEGHVCKLSHRILRSLGKLLTTNYA